MWPPRVGQQQSWQQAIAEGVKDQFMFGDDLLVAPVFTGEQSRQVIFPEGRWYDFYTGKLAGSAELKTISATDKRLPVFVRDGAIIPMLEKSRHAPRDGEQRRVILRHYGEKDGELSLYDDDGETFAYESGDYQWIKAAVSHQGGQRSVEVIPVSSNSPGVYKTFAWQFMTEQ